MKLKSSWIAVVVSALAALAVVAAAPVSPLRPIFGLGTANTVPKFTGTTSIGDSGIVESGGNVGIGTASPQGRLHVASNFSGGGSTAVIENADPSGDVAVDFHSAGGLVGNIGMIVTDGPPRIFLLENNPAGLNLTLAENGGNVGVNTKNPTAALDVGGNGNFSGDLTVAGNLVVTGTKSSVAELPNGQRLALYAVESTENWFEDFGGGRLSRGKRWVDLDPTFAKTVNTETDYHVYLTPGGNCRGLYVSRKTASGFEVRESGEGSSNVGFDYRIVARRRGYEGTRLQVVR